MPASGAKLIFQQGQARAPRILNIDIRPSAGKNAICEIISQLFQQNLCGAMPFPMGVHYRIDHGGSALSPIAATGRRRHPWFERQKYLFVSKADGPCRAIAGAVL